MLNIFILEDDFIQQSRLEKAVLACVRSTVVKYKTLEVFGKPNQLLGAIQETGNHQFFFLDIEIKGEEKKGMEIAREIRERDPYAVIVFVTTHSEFMPVTYRYRVSALDFIDKGLSNDEFQKAVTDVLVHAFENIDHTVAENSFIYKTENAHIQVPFSDILYFETSTTIHKVTLKTKTGQLEFYGKVSEISKADNRLYLAHRSYVVNPANVTKIDRTNHIIYFENGDSCLVSRLKQKKLVDLVENK
ncbi:TPA: response regulator transcription factor [Streptococcus pyogenes]|uniref:Response regulator transcription factor n=2 Tax=Streptococcus pyogenes TaxID=1314 RepID=A0A5S4TLW8_STRPY|nr:response regulator transcription factor [Streptococcus pyogenes]HER4687735.1 response regulator transcription factor [Streptococcus pyogenes NGAS364]HER4777578.1 response regulator transcription factor [Streptococcus pyogenes NGAS169]ESU92164.1 LytTr DNA-binding domain protein [Streptococcus pyogenes GA19702]QAX68614.1 DNA-binding response regulator [Streptococcus pyogenes]TYK84628.1 response regulator transcription factor [Streptococcus pyogenes]